MFGLVAHRPVAAARTLGSLSLPRRRRSTRPKHGGRAAFGKWNGSPIQCGRRLTIFTPQPKRSVSSSAV